MRAQTDVSELRARWSGDERWKVSAACLGHDPELFAPPLDIAGGERNRRIQKAKAVCETCPVREPCLAVVMPLNNAEDSGVWGGTTAEERRTLRAEVRDVAGIVWD